MTGTEVEVREAREIVIPGTMEVLSLDDTDRVGTAVACATRLDELRKLEAQIDAVKRELAAEVVRQAAALGVTEISLGGRQVARITRGTSTVYDPEGLERRLRKAGMPEARISEIVEQTVTHKVVAREAAKAAKSNPEYAKAIEQSRTVLTNTPTVAVRTR